MDGVAATLVMLHSLVVCEGNEGHAPKAWSRAALVTEIWHYLSSSRLQARSHFKVGARTDSVGALPYIAARLSIGVCAFKICSARIGKSAVTASVRQSTEALLARAQYASHMSASAVINRKELLRDGKHHLAATFGSAIMAVAVTLSMLTSPTIAAAEGGLSRMLSGVTIYLGVMASEIASEHLPAHPEAQMRGDKQSVKRFEHVVLAVYDPNANERVTDATGKASASDLGISSEKKPLEPMMIATVNERAIRSPTWSSI